MKRSPRGSEVLPGAPFQVFPLRGRCHGVTDEVVFGSKQIEITVGLFLLHLIRRKRHLPLKEKATGVRLRAGNVKCCPGGQSEVLLRKVMFRLAK